MTETNETAVPAQLTIICCDVLAPVVLRLEGDAFTGRCGDCGAVFTTRMMLSCQADAPNP